MLRLDLQFFSGEKTEKATPHKRKDARKKGQIAKSMEVSPAFTLLFTFSFLLIFGKHMLEGMLNIYRHSFQEYLLWDVTMSSTRVLFNQLVVDSVKLVAPIFLVVVLVSLVANYIQVGFMFNPDLLKVKFEKLNPIQGAKQILSIKSLVELLKALFKILIISFLSYKLIMGKMPDLVKISEKGIWDATRLIGLLSVQIGIVISASLIVLSVFDYLFKKHEHEKKIRMSKQDIKDEHKKMEGDPHVKGQRKAIQRQMAQNRMMQDVPKADVVITNPTHFAVAIRYDMKEMIAPIVIAKGQDHVALKIKELAKENKIMIVENKPLARALFSSVEIGEAIPEDLFNAVGEILAYVYYQEGRYKGMMA
ncbi:flagellar biosynthesis protein FlhB [Pseudoneobacillus sp. C159]